MIYVQPLWQPRLYKWKKNKMMWTTYCTSNQSGQGVSTRLSIMLPICSESSV